MSDSTDQDVILLRGRLNGQQRLRLKTLLNMMYKPSELAEEIGFNQNQVYMVYIPAGCPHERDEKGHIWINGKLFARCISTTSSLVTLEARCKGNG